MATSSAVNNKLGSDASAAKVDMKFEVIGSRWMVNASDSARRKSARATRPQA